MEDTNSLISQYNSDNAEVRRVVVEKIALLNNATAFDFLFTSIGDLDWRVRKTAVDSLLRYKQYDGFFERVYVALESDENAGLRNAAVEIITKLGNTAVNNITDFLSRANYEVKKFLLDALGDIKNINSVGAVAQFLNDEDENVRSSAAETLGKIKDKSSTKYLVEVLSRDELQLQFCALEALVNIAEPIAIDNVIPLINNRILRKAVFEVLGQSKDEHAVKFLVDGIHDNSKASREAAFKAIVNIYKTIDDPTVRGHIIELLSKISSPWLIKKISASLGSSHPKVKKSVITMLGFLQAVDSIPELLDVGDDDNIRECIFDSIIYMGLMCSDKIREEFMSRGDRDRCFLARLMGAIKDHNSEKILADSLKDRFGHLRSSAAISLAQLNQPESIDVIFPILNDQYEDVQNSALEALTMLAKSYPEEIRETIKRYLGADDDQLKINIITLIGRIGAKEDIEHLDLALRDGNPDVRTAAVYAIGEINVLAESKHLILTLTDESDKVRLATSKVLGNMYSEESFKALLTTLYDSNDWVKVNGMRSLARLNAFDAIEPVARFLEHDNPLLVINAIESLRELAAPNLHEYLSALLSHDDNEVVKTAVSILKDLKDEKALRTLLDVLDSGDPQTRIMIYRAFENVHNKEMIETLLPYIEKESDDMIKRMAKRVLRIN